jgi:hypothetical protein
MAGPWLGFTAKRSTTVGFKAAEKNKKVNKLTEKYDHKTCKKLT